ncbi:MAG TPA: ANTAR domain-containing protein [Firmicutes bacterium]|nr:ANTAR domain-containing protein [Bacillota bacterium]HHY97136.1 ANTAR domain-containing protein [Bacillota bacterium]
MPKRNVFIADADSQARRRLKRLLIDAGYAVSGEAQDGHGALRAIRAATPDVAMVDVDLPGLGGLEVARILEEDRLCPAVIIASQMTWEMVEKARESMVLACIMKPIAMQDLVPTIEFAIANYERTISLQDKIRQLEERLDTRKVVERAKGYLMRSLGISEAEAYRLIQKRSMDKGVSMRKIAEAILLMEDLKGG